MIAALLFGLQGLAIGLGLMTKIQHDKNDFLKGKVFQHGGKGYIYLSHKDNIVRCINVSDNKFETIILL